MKNMADHSIEDRLSAVVCSAEFGEPGGTQWLYHYSIADNAVTTRYKARYADGWDEGEPELDGVSMAMFEAGRDAFLLQCRADLVRCCGLLRGVAGEES